MPRVLYCTYWQVIQRDCRRRLFSGHVSTDIHVAMGNMRLLLFSYSIFTATAKFEYIIHKVATLGSARAVRKDTAWTRFGVQGKSIGAPRAYCTLITTVTGIRHRFITTATAKAALRL